MPVPLRPEISQIIAVRTVWADLAYVFEDDETADDPLARRKMGPGEYEWCVA